MKFFCGDFLGRLVFSFSKFQLHLEHGKLSDSRAILRDSEWCQILSNSSIQPNMQNLHLLYHVIELNLKYLGYFAVNVPFYYRFLNTEKDGMLQQLSYSVMIQIWLAILYLLQNKAFPVSCIHIQLSKPFSCSTGHCSNIAINFGWWTS